MIDPTSHFYMRKKIQFDESQAKRYRKRLHVLAFKTNDPIVFHKSWGEQKLRSEGWVIVSLTEEGVATGDVYGCDADVFAETYEPASDENPYLYRKSELIKAYQPGYPFEVDTILSDGYVEVSGAHTDADNAWIVQAPSKEVYIIQNDNFLPMYEEVDG